MQYFRRMFQHVFNFGEIMEVVKDPRVLSILLYIVDERFQKSSHPHLIFPILNFCVELCDRGEYLFATHLLQRLDRINRLRYFHIKNDKEGSKRVRRTSETLYRMLTDSFLFLNVQRRLQ